MARTKKRKTVKRHPAHASSKSRSSWRGMIRFGLVTFPVEAFNAHAVEKDHIALHQLHAECHSRIRYQKTCPIHGPVDNDEIVSGYEISKGKYVEISEDELEEARTDEEKALTVDAFVPTDEIDPFYFDGRVYVLAPVGEQAREPYSVFLEALGRQKRVGVGKIIFSGKEQIVLLRPYRDSLLMNLLNYAAEMRNPRDLVAAPVSLGAKDKKVKLAEQLIRSWTDPDFDFAALQDTYTEKLQAIIDAKVHGRQTVAPEVDEEEPDVINLTDALRKSLSKATPVRSTARRTTTRRPGTRAPAARKRRPA